MGYPKLVDISLEVKNSIIFMDKREIDLYKIIEEYKTKIKIFKRSIKDGYKKFPILRLFYGNNFIELYKEMKLKTKDISHLINSVTLGGANDIGVDYNYDEEIEDIAIINNINNYLEKIFQKNNIVIDNLFESNKVNSELCPGLYRLINIKDSFEVNINIINIYLNITNNYPTINTLLWCDKETTFEKIKSFLYRALFCDKPVLFTITNIENLVSDKKVKLIKILKKIYELKVKILNSYLLIIYDKTDIEVSRDIEQLIPEENILNNNYMKQPTKIAQIIIKLKFILQNIQDMVKQKK